MLPWESMTTSTLYEFVTAMASHVPDHGLVAPFLLAEWAEDEETDPRDRYKKWTQEMDK